MDVKQVMAAIRKGTQTGLNEAEAKALLKEFGVPVVSEAAIADASQAVRAADMFGYPVVVKGLGSALMHKTEQGLVKLNLSDAQAVEKAVEAITTSAGNDLEGFVVQPQIQGQRELVAGLFRDPQFGPVVMFGIGGVFTEALADVSFRLAPITESDASEMLGEIRAKTILGPYRGEKAIKHQHIIQVLMGLSRIAIELPQIVEIDINPLLATSDGRLWAVDALVVPGSKTQKKQQLPPAVSPDAIGAIFYPKSIAFVGASAQMGKWGHMLMANTISGGYKGQVFLVNPKTGTIAGRKTYPTVCDIPDPVDLAVVTIPAAGVLDL
ncbi:MAG: acetate--CoA ligase family protein, partial [Desulfobacterales bacterium]